jgi:hypothetical protein
LKRKSVPGQALVEKTWQATIPPQLSAGSSRKLDGTATPVVPVNLDPGDLCGDHNCAAHLHSRSCGAAFRSCPASRLGLPAAGFGQDNLRNPTYPKGCQDRPTSATSDYRRRAGSGSPPRSEPPRSSRASSMEFKEEIRCNFRSPQQYLSLAAFCAVDSPSRRAAWFDPMNAVGGTILV